MKKPVLMGIALSLLCVLFAFSGCAQDETINDKKTGAIPSLTTQAFTDGTYEARSGYYDSAGYGQKLTIEVHSGAITKASFAETSRTGLNKSQVLPSWTTGDKTIQVADLYQTLETQSIHSQGSSVDTVSGATRTCDAYRALMGAAVENARTGGTKTAVRDLDDTYSATVASGADPETSGTLSVTFRDGVITDASFDETKGGIYRSANLLYRQLFSGMTKETLDKQSLEALTPDPAYADEYAVYNALLQNIAAQHSPY
jgi:major membrane immunogen (membrane-anchored lipoprotein)